MAERVAHEIKNPLNGVALNLQVVRARAAKGDAENLKQFAEAAHADLEVLAVRLDALLALARPACPPIDLYHTLRALGVLYGAIAEGTLTVLPAPDTPAETSAGAAPTRFTIAAALDMATERDQHAECGVMQVQGDPCVIVRRTSLGGAPVSGFHLNDGVRDAAMQAGVRVIEQPNEIRIIFPRVAGQESRT